MIFCNYKRIDGYGNIICLKFNIIGNIMLDGFED